MQIRKLLVILISRAAGQRSALQDVRISQRQRSLAEMTEAIHSAQVIHRDIVNLSPALMRTSKVGHDLNTANKLKVLSGDYLLASVMRGLSEMRNTNVVTLMATAIGEHVEGQFMVEDEKVPEENATIQYWERRSFLRNCSLQANSCQSAVVLAGHEEPLQKSAYQFGKNFALAMQAFNELQPFLEPALPDSKGPLSKLQFDLWSAPVLLHIQLTKNFSVGNFRTSIEQRLDQYTYDFGGLHNAISRGAAIEATRDLIKLYCDRAISALEPFPVSDATEALLNVVQGLTGKS